MAEEISQSLETKATLAEVEDDVNPWSVTSSSDKGVDYDKLVSTLMVFILPWGHFKRGLICPNFF